MVIVHQKIQNLHSVIMNYFVQKLKEYKECVLCNLQMQLSKTSGMP